MNAKTAIMALKNRWLDLSGKIQELEARLDSLKAERMRIENVELVEALRNEGAKLWGDVDGSSIKIERIITARVEDGAEFDAYDFLDKSGYGAIIKTELKFQKGEDISEVEGLLEQKGVSYEKDLNVHYKSLEKAVREIVEESERVNPNTDVKDIIPTCIKVNVFDKAVIKINKEKAQ